MYNPYARWFENSVAAWSLAIDAGAVISMRTTNAFFGGDRDGREARLMIQEKVLAAASVQSALMTGKLGIDPAVATKRVLQTYSRKVAANRRRLAKL